MIWGPIDNRIPSPRLSGKNSIHKSLFDCWCYRMLMITCWCGNMHDAKCYFCKCKRTGSWRMARAEYIGRVCRTLLLSFSMPVKTFTSQVEQASAPWLVSKASTKSGKLRWSRGLAGGSKLSRCWAGSLRRKAYRVEASPCVDHAAWNGSNKTTNKEHTQCTSWLHRVTDGDSELKSHVPKQS